jgi:hypothetical protein
LAAALFAVPLGVALRGLRKPAAYPRRWLPKGLLACLIAQAAGTWLLVNLYRDLGPVRAGEYAQYFFLVCSGVAWLLALWMLLFPGKCEP